MRIGIYFSAYKSTGGVYQYSLTMLEALREVSGHTYVVFNTSSDFPFEQFESPSWKIVNLVSIAKKGSGEKDARAAGEHLTLKRMLVLKILDALRLLRLYRLELFLANRRAKRRAVRIDAEGVDVIFYPQPSELSFLSNTPSVVAVHSLQHRLQERFPEVTAKGQYIKREFLYSGISKNARRIIVDSATTRDDMIDFYGTDAKKFEILPYLPPDYITESVPDFEKQTVKTKYELPNRFIFYPAQFWPHKNHLRLLEALHLLKEKGILVTLVLVGSTKSEWGIVENMKRYMKERDLEEQVLFLGYVPNEELNTLYHMAEALILPTLFGPTPIPIIEAWKARCPVVYSKLRGSHERAENAALLFDPLNTEDMANCIARVWTQEETRADLIAKGIAEDAAWSKRDFMNEVQTILDHSLAH